MLFDIKFIKEFNGTKECGSFFLPNSVAVTPDGVIVIDGGNDRVCLLNFETNTSKCFGGKGLSRCLFKEPVAVAVSPQNDIIVADWHNHRIVFYDQYMKYLFEYGRFGILKPDIGVKDHALSAVGLFISLIHGGKYINSHFINPFERTRRFSNINIAGFHKSLIYLFNKLRANKNIFDSKSYINKPNGIAFNDNTIVVSQKNNRCLSVYRRYGDKLIHLENVFFYKENQRLPRLGNIVFLNNKYYVCGENREIIIFDKDLKYLNSISNNSESFNPFSIDCLDSSHIIVCGGRRFHVININTRKIVYESQELGELHGVAFDKNNNKLYIVDRFLSKLYVYGVSY